MESAPCPLDGQGNGLDGKRSWQKRSYTNWWLLFNVSYSRREGARCEDSDRSRLYSCTRTIDDKPRNYGSAKVDAEKAKAKAEV